MLREREMSPSQLARETGDVVGVASYHVRVLADAGLVRLVRTGANRGAVQHFYRATRHEPVGDALLLSERAADQLVTDIRAAIARAQTDPGDVPLVLVAHLERRAA